MYSVAAAVLIPAKAIFLFHAHSTNVLLKVTLASVVAALEVSYLTFAAVGPRTHSEVDGHQPMRFASDVFPVSLLTHELGHTLLMPDTLQNCLLERLQLELPEELFMQRTCICIDLDE
mmetsp:Transcript_29481/g.67748  ORF Transcript_29481/g.67748 Transcript_29481/m.67748 type:complete len:118 (-) Transcript_29481:83-436(-)